MTRSPRLHSQPESSPVLVEALDLDAQGITRLLDENGQPGKVVFIRGALPTEEVTYTLTRDKARFAKAKLHRLIKPAVYRTSPKCKVFGICGGCSMQHLDFIAQIAIKQQKPRRLWIRLDHRERLDQADLPDRGHDLFELARGHHAVRDLLRGHELFERDLKGFKIKPEG